MPPPSVHDGKIYGDGPAVVTLLPPHQGYLKVMVCHSFMSWFRISGHYLMFACLTQCLSRVEARRVII